MSKQISSPEDLLRLKEEFQSQIDLRGGTKDITLTVHMGTCGIAAGARDILAELGTELGRARIDYVTLRHSGCLGLCDQEPMMTLTDETGRKFLYGRLDKKKVHEIVREHIQNDNPIEEYLVKS